MPKRKEIVSISNKPWCWWCCHPIDHTILKLPLSYDSHRNIYKCYGQFCSFACMISYNNDSNSSQKYNRQMIISKMIKESSSPNKTLNPAPPRQCLKVFGGDLSIEEFRKDSIQNVSYVIELPPIEIINHSIERHQNTLKLSNKDDEEDCMTMFENKNTKIVNNPLKIKHEPAKINTLEKVLGITTNK